MHVINRLAMKKNVFTLFVLMPFLGIAQTPFQVTVQLKKLKTPTKAYLIYQQGDKQVIDSMESSNGSFQFKGNVPEPEKAVLFVDHTQQGLQVNRKSDMKAVFLEN